MLKNIFPVNVILKPSETFAGIAAGKTDWGWPLALYALSITGSAFMLSTLPPQFIAETFDGATPPQGRGFGFFLLVAIPGGLLFSILISALLSALTGFLRAGRLSLRLPFAALAALAYVIFSAAVHDLPGLRVSGIAAALGAAGLASWAAMRDKKRCAAMLKALLALSVISLLSELPGALAALAGSVKGYTASEYFFSLLSLVWLAKAAAAVYDISRPRAVSASILAIFGSVAFLLLLSNLRLLSPDISAVLLLIL